MKKIDWNAPMSRKNWAWIYGICTGFVILFYAVLWVGNKIRVRRFYKEIKEFTKTTEKETNEVLKDE